MPLGAECWGVEWNGKILIATKYFRSYGLRRSSFLLLQQLYDMIFQGG